MTEPCHTGPAALTCGWCADLMAADTGPLDIVNDDEETT